MIGPLVGWHEIEPTIIKGNIDGKDVWRVEYEIGRVDYFTSLSQAKKAIQDWLKTPQGKQK